MILFIVGNFKGSNTGAGGHYYSLLEMANQTKKSDPVKILSYGVRTPAMFDGIDMHYHIPSSLLFLEVSIIHTLKLIREQGWKVDVIHAYDSNVVFIGMVLAWFIKAKFCLTKCGGPIPKYYFPSVPYLFVFHPADYEYFSEKLRYSDVTLLPNRVSPPKYDRARSLDLFGEKANDRLVVFRVGRIGDTYKDTIIGAIELVKELNSRGIDSELKVIGHVESQPLLNELRSISSDTVEFYVDSKDVTNAASLLGYSDIVVGTGRGLIEAMAARRVVFFPVKGNRFPAILTEKSFKVAFAENFSQRVSIPDHMSSVASPDFFCRVIQDVTARDELMKDMGDLFEVNFDSSVGAKKLRAKYDDMGLLDYRYALSAALSRVYAFMLGVVNFFR